jgi:hypothetical protein
MVPRGRKSGPRRGANLDATLTPRKEIKSMRKASRIEAPNAFQRNMGTAREAA